MCKDEVRNKAYEIQGKLISLLKILFILCGEAQQGCFICKTVNTPFPFFGIFSCYW